MYFQEKLSDTFLYPMTVKSYVTSMGAWYGFMPRIRPEYKVDREHFVSWMNKMGIEASIPKSKPLPEYELFSSESFPINSFEKQPVLFCENAHRYHASLINFPTFSFHEFTLIDQYVAAIHKYMEKFL